MGIASLKYLCSHHKKKKFNNIGEKAMKMKEKYHQELLFFKTSNITKQARQHGCDCVTGKEEGVARDLCVTVLPGGSDMTLYSR